jgi:MICOS complex subunit MIC60
VKPKKKGRIIQKTFIYSTLLVLTAYGAGTAAALNNERIHDYFLENVPLGEQILDFAESKGFVGGLPRPIADPSFSPRRQRPTPSSSPSAEPPKKHEKIEAFKSRVEGKVKEKKERIRSVAAQLSTTAEKGAPHPLRPTHISNDPAAPFPPKSYSEGVEDLVKKVKSVLKGDPISLAEERRDQEVKAASEPEKQVKPAHAETSSAAPVNEEPREAPQGKKWYSKIPLPLGFEPPPGYAVPPPKAVPKTTAGLLLVAPAVAEFTASEPLLNELATTVDNLAKYLEDNPKAERSVNKILDVAKKDLGDLGTKIESVKKESKEKLEASLEEAAQSYSVKLLEAELNARDKLDTQDEEWRHYFEQERLSLLQRYQEKLDNELATQNDLINERYVLTRGKACKILIPFRRLKEEVIAQGIELQRRWIRDVQLHVEEERGGRLAKLEEVASGLKKLERLTLDNANYLDENLRLHAVWSALRALTNVTIDSPVRKPFRDELHVLKSVASAAGNADDTVLVAIESLEKSETPDVGLEPLADLTSWFVTSVIPRVNSVALVPDYGGGILMHLASSLLSSLQFKRSGLVQGDDTLSIMARAEYYLHEKDLDSAARELNQLQGPAKDLLRDWLTAARRRLEVQQALEVSVFSCGCLYFG